MAHKTFQKKLGYDVSWKPDNRNTVKKILGYRIPHDA